MKIIKSLVNYLEGTWSSLRRSYRESINAHISSNPSRLGHHYGVERHEVEKQIWCQFDCVIEKRKK